MGLETYEIGAMAVLKGMELSSWTHRAIQAVSIEAKVVHRWLNQTVVENVRSPDGREGWTVPELHDEVWDVCPGVRFRIDRQLNPSSSIDHFEVLPHHRLWLHFVEPQSLQEICDKWIPWTTRLLSLLVGAKASYEEIECFSNDPFITGISGMLESGVLIRGGSTGRKSKPLPHVTEMFAPFATICDRFGDVLKRWHEVSDRFEPLVDLFSVVEFHHSLHSEAQFLFLVQALEVYHVRSPHFESKVLPTKEHGRRVATVLNIAPDELKEWLQSKIQSGNYKPLNQKLEEIFNLHAEESRQLLGDDFANLAEQIRYTRNHLTHYNGDPSDSRFLDETAMFRVNLSLRALIWIYLLMELGISGAPVRKIIQRRTNMRFVMLADQQEFTK